MTIFDMKQDRADLVAKMRNLADKYQDTVMEGDDRDTYSNMEKKFDELNARIAREEKLIEAERMSRTDEKPVQNDKRSMFRNALTGASSDIAAYRNAYTLGTGATAGYLSAPEQFVEELIKGLDDDVFMRKIAHHTPTLGAAQSLGYPYRSAEAADANWDTEVESEGTAESTLAFGKREFAPNRMAKLFKVSKTLVQHSNMAEQVIMDEMRYRIAITQEKAYLTGNGSGKPLGVFVASDNGVPAARDITAGNTTSAFTADGLINAKYALKQQYLRNAQWIMHRDAVKMLAKLKDGTGAYIWQPGMVEGQPDRLLGLPVNVSEYAPNTFTTGNYVAAIGDFRYYWIMDADQLGIQVLNELYAVTNEVGYLFQYFGDGAPVVGEAFARVKLA